MLVLSSGMKCYYLYFVSSFFWVASLIFLDFWNFKTSFSIVTGFCRVAATRMARKNRRPQRRRRRRETSLMPATVSRVSITACVVHVGKKGFYFWKTRVTHLPCMVPSERPRLELWQQTTWINSTSECFLSPLFFFFPHWALAPCVICNFQLLTVQMPTSALWVCNLCVALKLSRWK